MKIYTVRKIISNGAGQLYQYYHTDVLARNKSEAISKAKSTTAWRWVDSFDSSSKPYLEYQVM